LNKKNIVLGTCGWSYSEWEKKFYLKGEKRKLHTYSHIFNTVEIDSTFYRYPTKGMVLGWLRYSPSNFTFSAKLPKLITHDKKLGLLGKIEQDLEKFFDIIRPLQLYGKLGCLLIQLPPSYSFNLDNLEDFFNLLDPMFKFAVEFRNLSWLKNETWDLLKKYGVAYTVVDEPLLPPIIQLTTDFSYFRWHGRGKKPWFDYRYSHKEIDPWVPKVLQTANNVKIVYGYFNNHYHGYAPENCLYLIEKLGLLTEAQKKIKYKVGIKQSNLEGFLSNQ